MKWAAQAVRHNLPSWLDAGPADAREGERLLESGNYAAAEAALLQVVAALKARSIGGRRHAKILLALAQSQARQNKRADATRTAEAALDLLTGPRERPSAEMAVCLDLMAGLVREEDAQKATAHLRKALEIERKIRPRNMGMIVERLRNLASILQDTDQPQEARDLHREALTIATEEFGEDHATTAACMVDLGKALSSCGEHEAARKSVQDAIDLYAGLFGSASEEVASTMQVMGTIYRAEGDLEKAINCYERALAMRERQLGSNAAELGVLLMSLAGANSDMGRYGPAVELMQQAVGRLEGAKDHRLAPALENLGNVYVLCGRFEDAVSSLQRARNIWKRDAERYSAELDLNAGLISNIAHYFEPERANAILQSLQTQPQDTPVYHDDPGYENRTQPLAPAAPQDRLPESRLDLPFAPNVPPAYSTAAQTPAPQVNPTSEDLFLAALAHSLAPPSSAPVYYPSETPLPDAPSASAIPLPPEPAAPAPAPLTALPVRTGRPRYSWGPLTSGFAAPIRPGGGENDVTVQFVDADGTPVSSSAGRRGPLDLTIIVPDGEPLSGGPLTAVSADSQDSSRSSSNLSGWEELSYEFCSSNSPDCT
ncbi:MAG: tetratricopeptide repeat protein [Bryobacteraceae bacterium]|nr:tetratricopeptide repeat protein [Bryobacteraceae bacterium]